MPSKLARLTPEGPLRLDWTVVVHMLLAPVGVLVDVILALTTLLSRQSFAESALRLVLGRLFLARFVVSAHKAILTADPPS
jgi:hypothetical protein